MSSIQSLFFVVILLTSMFPLSAHVEPISSAEARTIISRTNHVYKSGVFAEQASILFESSATHYRNYFEALIASMKLPEKQREQLDYALSLLDKIICYFPLAYQENITINKKFDVLVQHFSSTCTHDDAVKQAHEQLESEIHLEYIPMLQELIQELFYLIDPLVQEIQSLLHTFTDQEVSDEKQEQVVQALETAAHIIKPNLALLRDVLKSSR